MAEAPFKEYLFEYDHDGTSWCLTIKAADEADARARMGRMSLARYCGEVMLSGSVPFGGLVQRLFFPRSK